MIVEDLLQRSVASLKMVLSRLRSLDLLSKERKMPNCIVIRCSYEDHLKTFRVTDQLLLARKGRGRSLGIVCR